METWGQKGRKSLLSLTLIPYFADVKTKTDWSCRVKVT